MHRPALEAFARTNYLDDGYPHVIAQAQPHFQVLITELIALPEDAVQQDRLEPFRRCVLALNQMGDDIETVERECFCAALYALATIVGLDPSTRFLDRWRGDW